MKITGVIGVIIITFIILIVAAFTYSYVEKIREEQNKIKDLSINGQVINITFNDTITINSSPISVWNVTLSEIKNPKNSTEYSMIFEETYPPNAGLSLRFYYDKIKQNETSYLWITEIEKIE